MFFPLLHCILNAILYGFFFFSTAFEIGSKMNVVCLVDGDIK